MYYTRKIQVKPIRVTPRPSTRFGSGILASTPTVKAPAPLSDLEWYAEVSNIYGGDWDLDTVIDQRFAEAEACDRLERGLIPQDVANEIWTTSIVGH